MVALGEQRLDPAEPEGGLADDSGRIHLKVLAEVPDPAQHLGGRRADAGQQRWGRPRPKAA
jgi:hypothetical protein